MMAVVLSSWRRYLKPKPDFGKIPKNQPCSIWILIPLGMRIVSWELILKEIGEKKSYPAEPLVARVGSKILF